MSNATRLFVLAGAAMSFGSAALAQNTVDTDQVRATVREMLADAETRSSLLQAGGTAGHNGRNFYLADGAGNYTMNFFAYTQQRYTVSVAQNTSGVSSRAAAGNDSFDSGFSNNLTVFGIFGNFCSPAWGYVISMQMTDNTSNGTPNGTMSMYDGYITYKMDNNWKSQFGQYKSNFMREASLGDTTLMAANRSVLEAAFGQGRSQGLMLGWSSDALSASFEATDGFRTANTNWNSTTESDFCFGGRVNWRFAGTDDQLNDYTSMPGDQFGGMVGGAFFYEMGLSDPAFLGNPAAVPPTTDAHYTYATYTLDAQIEGGGFGLYAAFVGANTDVRDGASSNDFGGAIQGSWRFSKEWEIFARFDWIGLDDAHKTAGQLENNFFLTAGGNYYIAGHAAKVTIDAIFSLNKDDALTTQSVVPNGRTAAVGTGTPILTGAGNGTGLLGANRGAEAALRVQFQGAF